MRAAFYIGKYLRPSFQNPSPYGRCDYSGLLCQLKDLVPQFQYNATGLYDTGLRVNYRFLDKPNMTNLMPPIKMDPEPVILGRPGPTTITPQIQAQTYDVSGDQDFALDQEQFNYNNLLFTGTLTGPVTIIIPALFNEFNVLNQTEGDYPLTIQIENISNSILELPVGQSLYLTNTNSSLLVTNLT